MKKIKTVEQLKKISSLEPIDCSIILFGGIASRKSIMWNEKTKKFSIINFIDDTEQNLTEKQLFDTNFTHVGEAIKKGSLIY